MEKSTDKPITIGLFDDHPVVLDAIVAALQQEKELATIAFYTSSKEELLASVEAHRPDLLILDIISSEVSALELFARFRKTHPGIAIIAYSSLSSPVLVENLLFYGVKGFVNKRQPLSDLLRTVFLVAAGKIAVPEDYKYLTSQFKSDNTALLTEREVDIVQLIAAGNTSEQLARELGISINTVENHRKRIFLKLNVKNVAGMVLESTRLGYLQ
jgi:DNA-binding NarL/FixJ family response regulator